MFVGSRIHVGQVVQKTDYPWKGAISITLNPEQAKTFSVYVRVPDRTTSKLYVEPTPWGPEAHCGQWPVGHAQHPERLCGGDARVEGRRPHRVGTADEDPHAWSLIHASRPIPGLRP